MSFKKLEKLWEEFADVPIDKDECIDEKFYNWEKGTDRYEIWHWFDEKCPNVVNCKKISIFAPSKTTDYTEITVCQ